MSHYAVAIAMLLLWLALTGGYAGREGLYPQLGLINVVLATWGVCWLTLHRPKLTPFVVGVLVFVAAITVSAVVNNQPSSLSAAVVWLVYLGLWQMAHRWPTEAINQGAMLALAIYAPLGPLLMVIASENRNVVAITILFLGFLSGHRWLVAAAAALIGYLGSVAGLLATATAYANGRLAAIAAPVVLLLGFVFSPGGYFWRLKIWQHAAVVFWQNPLFGVGPGRFHFTYAATATPWPHSHGIIPSTAAELGLVGLAGLGLLVWGLWQQSATLPAWALALLLVAAVWSLIDEPLLFWGPGAALMLALSRSDHAPDS